MTFKFWTPKGKSSRTKTANVLDAWAADLRLAAQGFEMAATQFRNRDLPDETAASDAWMYGRGAFTFISMVLHCAMTRGAPK